MILAIDPGPLQSGWAITQDNLTDWRPGDDWAPVIAKGIDTNPDILRYMARWAKTDNLDINSVVVEEFRARGTSPVAQVSFDACRWSGRFEQRALDFLAVIPTFITRIDVKMEITGDSRAGNPNIRAALIDLYGGSRMTAIGIKKNPGPLHGFSDHMWSALALAVTFRLRYHDAAPKPTQGAAAL